MRTTLLTAALLLCSTAQAQFFTPIGGGYEYVTNDGTFAGEWETDGVWYNNQQYWNADVGNINGDVKYGNYDGFLSLYLDMPGVTSTSGYLDFETEASWAKLYGYSFPATIGSTQFYIDGIPLVEAELVRIGPGLHRYSWARPQGGKTHALLNVRNVPEPSAVWLLLPAVATLIWWKVR